MNNKKNIDKLFKEQLKNFELTPKDHVWDNIEERLHDGKRKKRRVIPFWWRVAGIAAGIVLLFTVANQVFNTSETDGVTKEVIGDESNINDNSTLENKTDVLEEDKSSDSNSNDHTVEQIAETNPNSNSSVENEENTSMNKQKSNRIGSSTEGNNNIASENSEQTNNEDNSTKNTLNNSRDQYKELLEEKKSSLQKPQPITKDAVANSNASESSSNPKESSKDVLKENSKIDKILKPNESDTNTTIANVNSTKNENSNEENPVSEVSQDRETNEDKDVNAIENAIAETEDTDEKDEEEEEKLSRWSVSPNVAPVYFSSFGEGSPLDNQFVENTKESEINMSYGITGSYAINKKLKIRTGINKVQLGYKTNDVLIFENTNPVARASRQIANVNLVDSMSQHSIYSARSFKFDNAPATLFTKEQGAIDQQLGFIEVPIEIEYNLIEKKIGLNLIGGFSTLFLSDNDVYAVLNNGNRTRLGEASNIKDLSYTANFGIGLDYNFSKQLQFNLEPTFKYQLNTFNNTSGDFNPFFIGLYTGLSFKF